MRLPGAPPLRVVHVLGWRSQQYGSFERFLVALSRRLRAVGGTLVVVAPEQPASPAFLRDLDAEIVLHPLAGSVRDVGAVDRLRRLLRRLRPTHLHVHHGLELYLAPFVGRLAGVPNRFATKHNLPSDSRTSALRHRWLAAHVDRVLAVSAETGERLLGLGLPASKVAVRYLGVDCAVYAPNPVARAEIRVELGLAEGQLLVLSTSHFRPGKGGELLPELAAGLLQDVPEAVVVAAGDGPERERIRARAAGLGVPASHFRLLGVRDDVPRLLAAADLFVFPTAAGGAMAGNAVNQEGLPLSVLEAAASGASVVSSAVSDLPQLLDGAVCFVPPGDTDALRRAAVALLRSPAERTRLGAQARDRVDPRFDMSTAAAAYVEEYLRT